MENKLCKNIKVLASMADNHGKLSIPAVFSLCMDLATEHGAMIKLGFDDLAEKGLFWLTTKTKLKFSIMPGMLTDLLAESWPEKPGRIRCNRFYRLTCGGEMVAEGKTEWAIISRETGKLIPLSEVYPEELVHHPEVICEEPFARIRDDFAGCEELERYKVRSTDIDLGQHMNNVAYVRVLFGAIPSREWEEKRITEVEVTFKSQSFEGEELTICRREIEDGFEIGILHADGKPAVVAIIRCK